MPIKHNLDILLGSKHHESYRRDNLFPKITVPEEKKKIINYVGGCIGPSGSPSIHFKNDI